LPKCSVPFHSPKVLEAIFGHNSSLLVPLHLRKGTQEYADAPPPSDAYRRSVKLAKALASRTDRPIDGEAPPPKKRSFFHLLRRPVANGMTERSNGMAGGQQRDVSKMPTDKSTEPLVGAAICE
jgi:hypothetical protein